MGEQRREGAVPGPLEGYRVVDCTAMITGPLATMMLADQGADVLKIEPPGLGDVMRVLGTQRGGMSAFFASCNRSKRSIAIDLHREPGRELARRLAAGADVFVQNFRPGVIERLGLSEAELRPLRPDLVYVSLSAFGESGPYARRPAYDHIIQGMSGLTAVQGDALSGRPAYVRNAVCDKLTALVAAQAITAALLARERGAGGQHVRLSMLDAAIAFLWPDGMMNQTILEDDVARMPPLSAAYQLVETSDGFLAVAVITDAQWRGLFRAVGRAELIDDPRFATAAARSQHLVALIQELGGGKVDLTTEEALSRLHAEDVPCGPLLSPDSVHAHPQVVASGTLVEHAHPRLGRIREPRPAARFERTPAGPLRPAPSLGEHTDETLRGLGLAEPEIAELRAKGVVA
jgi:crotonobetainyl-CoA:carnitine CoA-transferase CaiB-like acyl-CoA transferase